MLKQWTANCSVRKQLIFKELQIMSNINPNKLQLILGRQLIQKFANKGASENVDFPTLENTSFEHVEEAGDGQFTADFVVHRIENFHMTVQLSDEIKHQMGGWVEKGKDAEKAHGQVVVVCDVDANNNALVWHLVIRQTSPTEVAIESSEFTGNPKNITVTNKSCSYGGVNYREFDAKWPIVKALWESTASDSIKANYSKSLTSTNETFKIDEPVFVSASDRAYAQKLVTAYDGMIMMVQDYRKQINNLKGADLVFNNADEAERYAKQAAGAKVLIADKFSNKAIKDARELSVQAMQLMQAHEQLRSHDVFVDITNTIVGLRIAVIENFKQIAGKYSSIISRNFNERTYGQGTGMKRFAANAKSNDELCDAVISNLDNILSSLRSAQNLIGTIANI